MRLLKPVFAVLLAACIIVLTSCSNGGNSSGTVESQDTGPTITEPVGDESSCTDSDDTSPMLDLKPIIYLYPEKEVELTVRLGNPERLTCTYPEYKDGWKVKAYPDGRLLDLCTGRSLYSLYWEAESNTYTEFDEGFVVAGSDTAAFLEEKLSLLGLNDREAEEFIIFWLPKLRNNNYNLIRFDSIQEINEEMPLEFSVQPDTLIRVFMQYKPSDYRIDLQEQTLPKAPSRSGFTAVEWGGKKVS